MLLAIDVGNTNITIGVYNGDSLVADWRIRTQLGRTADEYGMLLLDLLEYSNLRFQDIHGIAISNVVPPTVAEIHHACGKYFEIEPFVVNPSDDLGIKIRYTPKSDVGADRIVNAIATFALYGGPSVLVDFGTATTYDAVSETGEYLGGAISPGIGISMEALFHSAARLPRIDLIRPPTAIGTTTERSMQSAVFGFAGQVDAMVARFKAELGGEAIVIATGGLAELIAVESKSIAVVNPLLTLEGLRLLFGRFRG